MSRLIKFRRKYFLMCADDLTTLRLAMRAYRSHPLTGGVDPFFEASICRLLIVNRVNFIESLLDYGKQLDDHDVLNSYFPPDENSRKASNRKRVELLKAAFKNAGFSIDEAIFNKYLALKLLRNVIVHGDLDPTEEPFIRQLGFVDLENLNLAHANEVIRVSSGLIKYIFETNAVKQNADFGEGLSRIMQDMDFHSAIGFNPQSLDCKLNADLGLVRKSDVARMFWNNLENISDQLAKSDLGTDEVNMLTAAAIESWEEFWRLTFTSNFVEISDLEEAVRFFSRYHRHDYIGLTDAEINTSSIVGHHAEKWVPNVTAASLFLKQLPKIDPDKTIQYRELGRQALEAWETAYYARKHPTAGSDFDYGHLETYRMILSAE